MIVVIGAVWDLAKRRIPNLVTGAAAVLGLVAQLVDRGWLSAASGLVAAVVSVALLYRPWAAGGIGGGDVKLAAAVAIWVGLGSMIRYALAVAAAGGVVALAMYFSSRKAIRQDVRTNLTLAALQQTLPTVEVPAAGRASVPYGLAIAAGAAFALLT
ncbi:MAG TPA: A24 family peptidase [Polyangia bacterium]